MENFVIATNDQNRTEAFYIERGIIINTMQASPENPALWTTAQPLQAQGAQLENVTRVDVTTNREGQTLLVAFSNNAYFLCIGANGRWGAWERIVQQ